MDFKKKYFKYKLKYNLLKKQIGGDPQKLKLQVRIIKRERASTSGKNYYGNEIFVAETLKINYYDDKTNYYSIDWKDDGNYTDHLLVISSNIPPKDFKRKKGVLSKIYNQFINNIKNHLDVHSTVRETIAPFPLTKSFNVENYDLNEYVSLISLKVSNSRIAQTLKVSNSRIAQTLGYEEPKTEKEYTKNFEEIISIIIDNFQRATNNTYKKSGNEDITVETRLVREHLLKKHNLENSTDKRGYIYIHYDEFDRFEKAAIVEDGKQFERVLEEHKKKMDEMNELLNKEKQLIKKRKKDFTENREILLNNKNEKITTLIKNSKILEAEGDEKKVNSLYIKLLERALFYEADQNIPIRFKHGDKFYTRIFLKKLRYKQSVLDQDFYYIDIYGVVIKRFEYNIEENLNLNFGPNRYKIKWEYYITSKNKEKKIDIETQYYSDTTKEFTYNSKLRSLNDYESQFGKYEKLLIDNVFYEDRNLYFRNYVSEIVMNDVESDKELSLVEVDEDKLRKLYLEYNDSLYRYISKKDIIAALVNNDNDIKKAEEALLM